MLELPTMTTAAAPPPVGTLDFLWLEVTGKCNLRCVHCYADSGPQRPLHEYMSLQDWKDILDQAAALRCRAVQFIGGEPTMYPELPSLIERARAVGFETIEVYTNGTHFKPRLKESFLHNRVDLAFSIYAENAGVHDVVTQQNGSFERTLESIRWALASGLSVRAAIIEMDANAGHTVRAQELLRAMGVTKIGVDRVRGVGRGKTDQPKETQLGELCGACTRGRLAVTASGEIFPCVFSRFWPVGHVREHLRSVVEGIPLRTFQQAMWADRGSHQAQADCNPTCEPASPCGPDLTKPCRPEQYCLPNGNAQCLPDAQCGPDRPCNPWRTPGPS